MTALWYEILLHWKLNLRSKEILVHFYLVPLVFYLFIGSIFTAIDQEAYRTLIPAMTVFAVTMGGVLGSPYPLVEFFGTEIKKSYRIGQIPLWTIVVGNFISSLFHLLLMSGIVLCSAPFLFHAPLPSNLLIYFLHLILLISASLGIGSVFGLHFQNSSKMAMMTQIVFLPSIMLSGIMFSRNLLPKVLQSIGYLFPATWGFEALCHSQWTISTIIALGMILILTISISAYKLKTIKFE